MKTIQPSEGTWYVYLLLCKSGRIYTGATPALDRRIMAHRTARGALHTRIDPPIKVLAAKPFHSKSEALRVEKEVKRVRAAHKMRLAETWSEQHPVDQVTQELLSVP